MPTSTTATKAKSTVSRGSAKPSTVSADKAERVTADDAVILDMGDGVQFGKVSRSAVPREALTKGERKNPYDAVMEASFKENDEANDDWREVKTKSDDKTIENQIKLIRNSAHYLEVGSRILKPQKNDDGSTSIWFRAQELRKKGPRKSKDETATVSE